MTNPTPLGVSPESVAVGCILEALNAPDTYDLRQIAGLPDHTLVVEDAGAILSITTAPAPRHRDIVRDVATTLEYNVVLFRIADDQITADVTLGYGSRASLSLRDLTLHQTDSNSWWLVPAGFGPAISISEDGVILELVPPYQSLEERAAGIAQAARLICHIHAPEVC